MTSAFFAFVHFLAAFVLVATVVFEWITLSRTPTHREGVMIQQADRWYGVSALLVLAIGFLRVFRYEKGSEFYFSSTLFYVKLGLFAAVGLLSIYPTMRFASWRNVTRDGRPPVLGPGEYRKLRAILTAELVLLAGLLLSASMMARGIGS